MTMIREDLTGKRKRKTAILSALIVAFIVLLLFLLGPMFLFRVSYGIPLSAKDPEGEIWFLIIGGGLGCGAAYFVFYSILTKCGFNEKEINAMWNGRKK
jgi:drug/metabolite transporter (DMT)-like permease